MSENVPPPLVGAEEVPLCKACQESAGLCAKCAERDRELLPQLAQEAWHKDAHSGRERELGASKVVELPTTPEERKERQKAARAKHRADSRLKTAMAGGFTRSRPKRAA